MRAGATFADRILGSGDVAQGPDRTLRADDLRHLTLPGAGPDDRVALVVDDTPALLRALAALDGRVGSILLLSGSLDAATVQALAGQVGATLILSDRSDVGGGVAVVPTAAIAAGDPSPAPVATRWLMTTSGTTGVPKVVPHDLRSLSRTVMPVPGAVRPVWGLLYDPTRFAGLQVVLQSLLGGGLLVAPDRHRPLADQVAWMAERGVTHLSATPTLWRRLLMVPGCRALPLRQATLGGEIADRATLAALGAAFPEARLSHIYASTEAGVGFSVTDREPGFPAAYLQAAPGGMRLDIRDGILWLRPPGPPRAPSPGVEVDAEGFVRSGDRVEPSDGRVLFLGRDSGVINIGGVKVHPERVEAVLADVEGVALAKVTGKGSAVTGALVLAEVRLAPGSDPAATKARILEACRARLEREAVPAIIRFVGDLETNAAGKLVRREGSLA